jgi:hypothetical protein
MIISVFLSCISNAQVSKINTLQIGDTNNNSIQNNAVLQIDDFNRGFLPPRLTTLERNNINNPANGLIIYNITLNCLEWFNGTQWQNSCSNGAISATSGGTAIVSGYSCSTNSSGILKVGTPVSNVTQTITVSVTVAGSYSISATVNGVIFSGSGIFSSTGSQEIILTAYGQPTVLGNNTFNLLTTPSCSFIRTVTN